MKILGVFLFLIMAFLFQCGKEEANTKADGNTQSQSVFNTEMKTDKSDTTAQTEKDMDEIFNYSGENDGLKYNFSGKLQKKGKYDGINYPNDNLVIEYSVKNTNSKDFLVYNQGHSDESNQAIVYVEPQASEVVELSQKMFTEPKNKDCPDLDAPIVARAAWLKAGETISEKVLVELPLELKTPFDECSPKPQMPKNFNKIKFCLGAAQADSEAVKIDENGYIQNRAGVSEQKLLCSGEFALP